MGLKQKIEKIGENLIPQKQYYDFEVDKILKDDVLGLVEDAKRQIHFILGSSEYDITTHKDYKELTERILAVLDDEVPQS